jgi:hypothetical protein
MLLRRISKEKRPMPTNRKLAVLFLSLASAILLAASLWGQEASLAEKERKSLHR